MSIKKLRYQISIIKIILIILSCFCVSNLFFTTKVKLPSCESSLIFYSSESRRDFKQAFLKSLNRAETSIVIYVYDLTDEKIIKVLNRKAQSGLAVKILIDQKHQKTLYKKLNPKIEFLSCQQRGLMHLKIFVIDGQICFLGSANLTPTSLRMHNNLTLGLFAPILCRYLTGDLLELPENPFKTQEKSNLEFWLLPSKIEAFDRLLSEINSAKKSIKIAMFTFTHPLIANALIAATLRGVHVRIIFDYLTFKGASRNVYQKLKESPIDLSHNRGMQLMHHKYALIDDEVLILGSANWTKSAFEKNKDFLLFLKLDETQSKEMKKLMRNLWWESKKIKS